MSGRRSWRVLRRHRTEDEIAVIDTVLASALPFRPVAFDELRDPGRVPDFDPGREG
jgi:hypothetical protein